MRILFVNPDVIPLLQPTQIGAQIRYFGVREVIRGRHGALKRRHTENGRVEIDIADVRARQTVEKHVVTGDNRGRRDYAVHTTDIDPHRFDQSDVLIFVKGIQIIVIKRVIAHGERNIGIKLDEGASSRLLQYRAINNRRGRRVRHENTSNSSQNSFHAISFKTTLPSDLKQFRRTTYPFRITNPPSPNSVKAKCLWSSAPNRPSCLSMQNLKGIFLMILAMAGFALGDTGIKALSETMSLSLIILILGASGTVVFATISRLAGEPIWSREMLNPTVLIRGVAEIVASLFMVNALALTPLSLVTTVTQAGPLVVVIGAVIFFDEQVGWRRWVAIFVGLTGVLIVLRPGTEGFDPLALLAVGAMASLAARDLATRATPKTLSNIQLGTVGFASFILAALVLATFTDPWTMPQMSQSGYIALAILPTFVAYYAITTATRIAEISVVAPFRYARLLFGVLLGILFFGETLDAYMLVGGALVVGSGVYTVLREHRMRQRAPA